MFITFGPGGSRGLGYVLTILLREKCWFVQQPLKIDKICTILESLEY